MLTRGKAPVFMYPRKSAGCPALLSSFVSLRLLLVRISAAARCGCGFRRMAVVIVRERRPLRCWQWTLLEGIHHQRHAFLQLRIMAGCPIFRCDVDVEIRCDAIVLNVPLAIAI